MPGKNRKDGVDKTIVTDQDFTVTLRLRWGMKTAEFQNVESLRVELGAWGTKINRKIIPVLQSAQPLDIRS